MTIPALIDRKVKRRLLHNFLCFIMKKVITLSGVLLLFMVLLSGCSFKQISQNKQLDQTSKDHKQSPSTVNQQKNTEQSNNGQAMESIPSAVSYLNEKYGFKITFPSKVTGFETVETPLKDYRAYNPLFDIEFGKDKNDFFEADGQKHGNMLSMWIFDRKKCDSLKLDKNEKSFCDNNKNVTDTGSWRGYEQGDITKGIWFGDENYFYYIFDPSFSGENGLLGKIKVELLKI